MYQYGVSEVPHKHTTVRMSAEGTMEVDKRNVSFYLLDFSVNQDCTKNKIKLSLPKETEKKTPSYGLWGLPPGPAC